MTLTELVHVGVALGASSTGFASVLAAGAYALRKRSDALGVIDMGNPARDGGAVHPIDGATGYDLMASTIAAAVLPAMV
jgi:hypothetical protein